DVGDERAVIDDLLQEVAGRGEERLQEAKLLGGAQKRDIALCARFLGDGADDVRFGAEITIEGACADPGLGANLLHRRLMEAATANADDRRVHDLAAASVSQQGISDPRQDLPSFQARGLPQYAALHIKRMFVL